MVVGIEDAKLIGELSYDIYPIYCDLPWSLCARCLSGGQQDIFWILGVFLDIRSAISIPGIALLVDFPTKNTKDFWRLS